MINALIVSMKKLLKTIIGPRLLVAPKEVISKLFDLYANKWISSTFSDKREANYRKKIWDAAYKGIIDTWDYRWLFAVLTQNGISVLPKVNLISNIGFGRGATHTQKDGKVHADLQTSGVEFPLIHPSFMVRDAIADGNYKKMNMNWKIRLFEILQQIIPKSVFYKLSRQK